MYESVALACVVALCDYDFIPIVSRSLVFCKP